MKSATDWVTARLEPGTAQWLMDIGVLHYADDGWIVDRDIWETRRAASADTHPKDGDALAAPLVSGAVPEGQTPKGGDA